MSFGVAGSVTQADSTTGGAKAKAVPGGGTTALFENLRPLGRNVSRKPRRRKRTTVDRRLCDVSRWKAQQSQAMLQGNEAARQQGSKAARQQGRKAGGKRFLPPALGRSRFRLLLQ
ncbi:hypothetical protein DCS_06097 [Drechmeria coniospora]|uniref:Uncharacterized protein n=1 Tax=Drechmeria coniospora TaxID=98403 RepID=A0A151GAM3_DRECN|nr:hypothetical protein DCS_06097 [Drechmeria coniospora]KYK54140.1 hypothetical protein DCS_06097 [Drechmeria coniospora]